MNHSAANQLRKQQSTLRLDFEMGGQIIDILLKNRTSSCSDDNFEYAVVCNEQIDKIRRDLTNRTRDFARNAKNYFKNIKTESNVESFADIVLFRIENNQEPGASIDILLNSWEI